jgi:hypothetical protein
MIAMWQIWSNNSLLGRYFFKEKIGVRAISGSLPAIMGVILMFLF